MGGGGGGGGGDMDTICELCFCDVCVWRGWGGGHV